MRLIPFLILLFFITSCSTEQIDSNSAKIYGEIVNPLDGDIIFFQNGKLLDTIKLQKDGKFAFDYKLNEEAMLSFKHGAERQMFYAKPGDSIALRVNTLEFDESLVYDADSSIENNFLINNFLLNEKNNDLILSYYKIEVGDFIKITDSLKNIQLSKLKELQEKYDLTPMFIQIAQKSINYEFFDMKERYAFLIQKYFSDKAKQLHEHDYFSFRKNIDFNDEHLSSHFGYLRFLDNYLKNKSIEDCKGSGDKNCYELNSFKNLHKRIEIANQIFENEEVKNKFLKRFVRREIIQSNTEEDIATTLKVIKEINLDEKDLKYYHRLADFQKDYLIGKSLGDFEVYNSDFEKVNFRKIVGNKPSVLHLWTANSTSLHQKRLNKIKDLREKFPEVQFIGINIDYENRNLWKRSLNQYKYNKDYEFQVLGEHENSDLYVNYLSKVFYVSTNSATIENCTNLLYSNNLESSLLAFLNK
jgi:hypothetical protein